MSPRARSFILLWVCWDCFGRVFVFLCVCLFLSICESQWVFTCVWLYVCLSVYGCEHLSVCWCLCVSLCVCVSEGVTDSLWVWLIDSMCVSSWALSRFECLSLSVWLCVWLCVWLSVWCLYVCVYSYLRVCRGLVILLHHFGDISSLLDQRLTRLAYPETKESKYISIFPTPLLS